MKTFSQLMREHRRRCGMTLSALAKQSETSQPHLSLVERGKRKLDEEKVLRIASVLEMPIDEALLGSLRERLSPELRKLVPEASTKRLHAAAWRLQAEHADYEVDQLRIDGVLDWDGTLRLTQTFENCRPNRAGYPVGRIEFRDRIVGVPATEAAEAAKPSFKILKAPVNLEHVFESTVDGSWWSNRVLFPNGWKRSAQVAGDAFSFQLDSTIKGAYDLDPERRLNERKHPADSDNPDEPGVALRGSFVAAARHHVKMLWVTFQFPGEYVPEVWKPWVWTGLDTTFRFVTRNLVGGDKGDDMTSRSLRFDPKRGNAKLVVEQPLIGYKYAIVWVPADRWEYLAARNKLSEDKD